MAKYAKRLGRFSSSGSSGATEISEASWDKLQYIYGYVLDPIARQELVEICNNLGFWEDAESKAEKVSELSRRTELLGEAIGHFSKLTHGGIFGGGDVGVELRYLFLEALSRREAQIGPRQVKILEKDGWQQLFQTLPDGQLAVFHDFDSLVRLTMALTYAVAEVRREVGDQTAPDGPSALRPGNAFKEWCSALRTWAKSRKFNYGPFQMDQSPSRFSAFAFELLKHIPRNVDTPPPASVEAMADRFRRANRGR